jgi:predicted Zn-ribbon and HTH transcriptional regulator
MNEPRIQCKVFRAVFKSWETLFDEATEFANSVGRDNVISISHASDHSEGIVAVWYWGVPDVCRKCGYDLTGNTSGRCPECGAEL